jgi:hypothetical protein
MKFLFLTLAVSLLSANLSPPGGVRESLESLMKEGDDGDISAYASPIF